MQTAATLNAGALAQWRKWAPLAVLFALCILISLFNGNFLTLAINFIIVAFVLFLVIRGMNMLIARTKKEEPAAAPPPPAIIPVLRARCAPPPGNSASL